jgi:peptidoglycan/LPS O-acetylase OafA/YrhL
MVVLDLVWTRVAIPPLAGSMLPAWVAYASILLGVSFAIAWVSWRCLERPMLSLKEVTFHFSAPTTLEW